MTKPTQPALLEVTGLSKAFEQDGVRFDAVRQLDLLLAQGETLAIVGPSGCGKSTLARLVMRLIEPDSGSIRLDGIDLLALHGPALRRQRRRFQMVFQDPQAALNPRTRIRDLLADPLRIHGLVPSSQRDGAVAALLEDVGVPTSVMNRYVHEVSGGQRQRIALARALAVRPDLIVLDEALSALDVAVRADIVRLLQRLQAERGIAYLFISHDLALVRAFATRIAIMEAGRIVETGAAAEIIDVPASDLGKALVEAAPALPFEPSKFS